MRVLTDALLTIAFVVLLSGLAVLVVKIAIVIYQVLFKSCPREQMGYTCHGELCECKDGVEL